MWTLRQIIRNGERALYAIKKASRTTLLDAFEQRGSSLITIDHVLSWYLSTNLKSRFFFK